ncbi:cysteine desulfurase [Candidatus Babeliales bacterium]|nr:cysteine desulfurase [Candidatus Babeliales bacterium]
MKKLEALCLMGWVAMTLTTEPKMEHLRNDFPYLREQINGRPIVYFDNGATTQKPQHVIDALVDFYINHNANVHRGIYQRAERATAMFEAARETVAEFIGAREEEIVFTKGTTESCNIVADSWLRYQLQPGDEVITTALEHHSNLLPWQQACKAAGAILKIIPLNEDGSLDMEAYAAMLSSRTKFVAATHVSNVLGTVTDVQAITALAHKVGAKVLIDAAQSVARKLVNVSDIGCEFVVFSGHKMFGPTSVGVLYVAKSMHAQMQPYQFGGAMVLAADYQHAAWMPMPQLLEAGTPGIAQVIGLAAAVDYIDRNIDAAEVRVHEAALVSRLIEGLSQYPRVKLLGPVNHLKEHGHLVSFLIDGMHTHDIAAFLDTKGICVRAGKQCAQPLGKLLGFDTSVRASFCFYNTLEEVDYFLEVIDEIAR